VAARVMMVLDCAASGSWLSSIRIKTLLEAVRSANCRYDLNCQWHAVKDVSALRWVHSSSCAGAVEVVGNGASQGFHLFRSVPAESRLFHPALGVRVAIYAPIGFLLTLSARSGVAGQRPEWSLPNRLRQSG